MFALVRELCVAGCECFRGLAQNVLSGFGDNMFGCLPILCDGLGSCVSLFSGSGLASGGHVAMVVEGALFHV